MKKSQIISFIALLGSALSVPVAPASAQTWTPTVTPSVEWQTVTASADGRKLYAGSLGWIFGFSTNSGSTWVTNTEPQYGSQFGSWIRIAASADGTKLAAVNYNAYWISTNSGATWTSNVVAGVSFFWSVAMSADGTKLVIADGHDNTPGLIYFSTNCGATLTPSQSPTNYWTGLAASADGTRFYAFEQNTSPSGNYGLIYASTNSGMSWTLTGAPTNNNWWGAIASSSDGSKLIASCVGHAGGIYTSTNCGATWTSNAAPYLEFTSVASSADGTRLVAAAFGGIYTSINSGASWVSNSVPAYNWFSVASSADGGMLVVAAEPGTGVPIYVSQIIPSLQLSLTASSTNLMLSWIIPSTNFIVQQSPDLASWTDLPASPVLNLTNLQNQITLSASNPAAFYRLTTP
jgi:hypothetical protein